ncbi:hypothetical protein FQA47_020274 [Oryzias melastigma]|uniref:Uncharacterized protein n=1 Tax=Oryzias melastigma TaxID=30732 RepID=A0A834KX08_ORYME|nr:hypothetical protein FQA47_020274 [Oryzias melastigma]
MPPPAKNGAAAPSCERRTEQPGYTVTARLLLKLGGGTEGEAVEQRPSAAFSSPATRRAPRELLPRRRAQTDADLTRFEPGGRSR